MLPIHSMLDARRDDADLLPSDASGAWMFFTTKTVVDLPTDAVNDQIMALGEFIDQGIANLPDSVPPVLGWVVTTATTAPQVASWVLDGFFNGVAAQTYNISLHELTIEVQSFQTATTATGKTYVGTVRGRYPRNAVGTYTTLSASLKSLQQMKPFSQYELVSRPRVCMTAPMDQVSWNEFRVSSGTPPGVGAATPAGVYMTDALSPMFVVHQAGATPVSVNVYAKYRLIHNNDRIVQAAQQVHPVGHPEHLRQAMSFVHAHGGHVLDAIGKGVELAGAAGEMMARLGPIFP